MKSEKVAKGAVYLTVQSIIGYFFLFLFYMLIARIFNPTQVGQLSILLLVSSFFMLSNLSLQFILQKYIPKYVEDGRQNETGSIIRAALIILISVSTSFLIILVLFNAQLSIFVFGSTSETWPLVLILVASFFLNLSLFFGGAMLGYGMFKEIAIQNILNIGVSRILAISLAIMGLGLVAVATGWLIAAISAVLYSIFVLRHKFQLKEGFSIKKVLEFSLPVHVLSIILFIQGWVDIAILYALAIDLSDIGTYYLVASGVMVLSIFYIPISMVILPALASRYTQLGAKGMSPMAETYIRIVSKILIPLGFSFAALSSTAIEVAFGPQYTSGAIPFALLAATIIAPALVLLMVNIIQSIGDTKPLIIIGAASSITDIVLVTAFASSFGGIAGAAGRISFSIVGVILGYYFVRKSIKLNILTQFKQPLLAATIIAIPLYILDQYLTQTINLTLRLRVPIDILTFIAITITFVYLTHYISKEDFDILRQAMPKKLEIIINKIENIFTKPK